MTTNSSRLINANIYHNISKSYWMIITKMQFKKGSVMLCIMLELNKNASTVINYKGWFSIVQFELLSVWHSLSNWTFGCSKHLNALYLVKRTFTFVLRSFRIVLMTNLIRFQKDIFMNDFFPSCSCNVPIHL